MCVFVCVCACTVAEAAAGARVGQLRAIQQYSVPCVLAARAARAFGSCRLPWPRRWCRSAPHGTATALPGAASRRSNHSRRSVLRARVRARVRARSARGRQGQGQGGRRLQSQQRQQQTRLPTKGPLRRWVWGLRDLESAASVALPAWHCQVRQKVGFSATMHIHACARARVSVSACVRACVPPGAHAVALVTLLPCERRWNPRGDCQTKGSSTNLRESSKGPQIGSSLTRPYLPRHHTAPHTTWSFTPQSRREIVRGGRVCATVLSCFCFCF